MEQRNNCAGPRSMMDEHILRQILADMADASPSAHSAAVPGCGNRNRAGSKSCGKPCGCDNGIKNPDKPCLCGNQPRQEMVDSSDEPCIAGAGIPTLAGLPLVMAYVPNQAWEGILEPEEALAVGTLFTGLNFPWYPSKCRKSGRCGR